MNDNVARIKTIDSQLKSLDQIISSGEYMAAGLSVSLAVGVPGDDTRFLDIGLCDNLDAILGAIKTGLLQARKQRLNFARSDLRDLQAFFDNEGASA